ncbi:conserved Plasmodium protein, unknown function [Plasmodium gallinaceum]|uniref:Tubby C-terminal domain-containing protein n=1 Tax=Plasmodium gallinaceum TaxID=5849 RepID=A0A1J1GT16_PLAGA|nr:conserved Plasmodium protein, unknown function [Plasmodium gallinaceum]CRG95583.1 conserved Plasmodium protein, unknown function [Plasmodium gallinaceum]
MKNYKNSWKERQDRLENIIKKEYFFKQNVKREYEENITGGFIANNRYNLQESYECSKCEYIVLIITEYIKKECILDKYVLAYKKLYDNIEHYFNKISKKSDIDYIIDNYFLKKSKILNQKEKHKDDAGRNYIEMETYTISIILKIKKYILNTFPMLKNVIKDLKFHDSNFYISNRIGIIENYKKKIFDYTCEKKKEEMRCFNKDTQMKYTNFYMNLNAPYENNMRNENYDNDFTSNNYSFNSGASNGNNCNISKYENNYYNKYNDKISFLKVDNAYTNEYYIKPNENINDNKRKEFNCNIYNSEDRNREDNNIDLKNLSDSNSHTLSLKKFYEIKITTNKNLVSLKSILLLIEVIFLLHSYFIKCEVENKKNEKINLFQLHEYRENIICDEINYTLFYNIILGKLKKKKKDEKETNFHKEKNKKINQNEKYNNNYDEQNRNILHSNLYTFSKEICLNNKNNNFNSYNEDSYSSYEENNYSCNNKNIYLLNEKDNYLCNNEGNYSSIRENNDAFINKNYLNEDSNNHSPDVNFSEEEEKINNLSEKQINKINEYINYLFTNIIEECDICVNIEFLYTLHIFQFNFLFNIFKNLLLKTNIEDDIIIMLTYCAYNIQNKEIIDYCFWKLIGIFEKETIPNSWIKLDKINNQLKKYKEISYNKKETDKKKNYSNSIFYETLSITEGDEIKNNLSEIDISCGNIYFKKNLIDKSIFKSFIERTKKEFFNYNDIPKGYVINELQRLRNFNDHYSCCYILKNNKKQKILMGFKKRGENKVYIYKYDKKIKKKYKTLKTFFNISGFLGVLICNFTGMEIKIYDNGISEKFSNFFPNFERNNVITITFESNIISELPRHFICNIYKENKNIKFIYENKCPIWNEEKEIYELPFYGRVKLASAKNLQLILKKCVIREPKKRIFLNKSINDVIEYMTNKNNQKNYENDDSEEYDDSVVYKKNYQILQNKEANRNEKKSGKKFSFDIIKNTLKEKEEKIEIINKDEEEIFLIFGKNSKDYFTLDFRHPLSTFEAFAIAISSLLKKKAVS